MLGGIFEQNKIKEKLLLFDKKISQPDFWKNQSTALKIQKEKKFFENILENFNLIEEEFNNLDLFLEPFFLPLFFPSITSPFKI